MATSECAEDVQCSPNMRVADCATCWVCKCLQLIYLSALPLTLFDIYITLCTKTVLVKRVCLGAITIYQRLEFLWALWFAREHDKWWGLGPFDDKQVGHVQSIRAVGIETWYSLIYPYLALHCAKSAEQHLTLGWSNLMSWQPPNVEKTWPESKNLCCWLFQLHHRESFSCRSDTAFAYYIAVYHWQPVQCRLSMRVADCATFWVCKCLQLIYLSALPLTLFDIYIRLHTKTVSVKRVCLGAITIYQRLEFLWALWFAREHDKWWGWGPFDDKQVVHVQSIRAVGIETWYSLIYPYLAFHCAKSAERHWLFVGATSCDGNLRMCRRSDQSKLKRRIHLRDRIAHFVTWRSQIAESTDTWMRQRAWCLVAYPIVCVPTTELSES